jgi:DNA-binding Lrp family transcriptional regulator
MGCCRAADDKPSCSEVESEEICTLGRLAYKFNPMDALLELLHQNATIPRGDLAKMLNLSIEEVESRIDGYEKDRVILGYQAVVDPEKIDADAVTAFIEVSITPERGGGFDRLAQRIARFDEVKSCWLMSGGYDLAIPQPVFA